MVFPITAGEFRRVAILQEDRDGLEVGAEYTLASPHGPLLARAYIYPAVAAPTPGSPPGTLPEGGVISVEKDFERHKLAVLQFHPGIQAMNESHVVATNWDYPRMDKVAWFEYQETSTGPVLKADLWVYPTFSGSWAVRYLFTYPKTLEATSKIATFMRAIPLNVPNSCAPLKFGQVD